MSLDAEEREHLRGWCEIEGRLWQPNPAAAFIRQLLWDLASTERKLKDVLDRLGEEESEAE